MVYRHVCKDASFYIVMNPCKQSALSLLSILASLSTLLWIYIGKFV